MADVKILIVEDEQDYRDFLQHHLEDHDYRVVSAGDGAEALNAFTEEEFDLVFLDHRLPNKDGVEILQQMKAVNRETPIVMMTAYGYVQSAVQAIKSGAFDYVAKEDLTPDMLDMTIAKALERQRLRTENERLRLELAERYSYANVVGKSLVMREIFRKVE